MKKSQKFWIERFKKFLREENIATQFYVNCFIYPVIGGVVPEDEIKSVEKYLKSIPPEVFIANSFMWMYAEEGFDFWDEKDIAWNKHVNILKKL